MCLTCGPTSGGRRHAHGDVIIVRYADDFVVGFQHESDAERFQEELRERFAQFNLELHAEKTRVIEFGRFAAERRERVVKASRRPSTSWASRMCATKTRQGKFTCFGRTMAKRMRAKLKILKAELRRRMHLPVSESGRWLGQSLDRALSVLRRARATARRSTRFRDAVVAALASDAAAPQPGTG